ncbi:MAG: hypothetical protein RSC76_01270 [Oscillospiraceae bacterium]
MTKLKKGLLCVLALILAGAGILVAVQWPRPTVVEMGKPITLSVEENNKTRGIFNYYRGFSWFEGACAFTVTDAKAYPSIKEAGISAEDMAESKTTLMGRDIEFLLLKLHVKNIDAVSVDDEGNHVDFNIGHLSLLPERYFTGLGVFDTSAGIDHGVMSQEYDPNLAYFSDHMVIEEGARSNPYSHFKLKPGESTDYEIGFFATADFIENEQMMLSYGINKYASKIEVEK